MIYSHEGAHHRGCGFLRAFFYCKNDLKGVIFLVKINGNEENAAGVTVTDYLEQNNYNAAAVVVERNENILPKSEYGTTAFADGDSIEIVCFMAGG